MSLSAIAVRRPVFAVMVMAAILILGTLGFRRLGSQFFPDVTFPAVSIVVPYPGASPSEVESLVVEPLEDAMASLGRLERIRSMARDGSAEIFILFDLEVDLEAAANQVRERVAQTRPALPAEIEEPLVERYDVAAVPILSFALGGDRPLAELRSLADDVIAPQLEQIEGVADVRVQGGPTREIQVELDRVKMEALRLSPLDIAQQLRAENLNLPAGHYAEGQREVSVRTLAEFESVRQVRDSIVTTSADGAPVRLADIARIVDGSAEMRLRARVNGRDAVQLLMQKQPGTNSVEVANAVKRKMSELQAGFPEGVTVATLIDQARLIESQVRQVEEDIVFGGLMAVVVIFLFMLDLRSTLISAVALPTSVLGTFYVMYVLGYTLNTMTLLGLSLAIGLLIDDAVVVRENIFKHLQLGKSPIAASLDGTKEVALSVVATTMTIVAVFMPIAFLDGIVGQFFKEFGITISAAVLISTFVALTLDPMLSSRLSKAPKGADARWRWLKVPFEWFHREVEETYRDILGWAVCHRLLVGALAVSSLVLMGYVAGLTGKEFMAAEDHGQFLLDVELPAGTSLRENARATLAVENKLLEHPEIETVSATIGAESSVNKTTWRVIASSKNERTESLADLKAFARETASVLPGARVSVMDPPIGEGESNGAPIVVQVRGREYDALGRAAEAVAAVLASTPGVGDVVVKHSPGRPELAVRVARRRAAASGLSAAEVAGALRIAMVGETAGHLRQTGGQRDIPIRVRLDEDYRSNPSDLSKLPVRMTGGAERLEDIVDIEDGEGPQVFERLDRKRAITVWATPVGRGLGDVAKDFRPRIAALPLSEGVSIEYDGQLKSMDESDGNIGIAFLLSIAFIYIVLASQFESFVHPVTVMITLPLALVGAILALFLTDSSLAMGSMIGIILLMGLVTKNAILLLDRAIAKTREGFTPGQAVAYAGPERLRPILMTSAAMVLGMLPTAVGTSEGSEFRAPMAIAVIGGVVSSTLLSLVVVPVLYLSIEDLKAWLRRKSFGSRVRTERASVSATGSRAQAPGPVFVSRVDDTMSTVLSSSAVSPTVPSRASAQGPVTERYPNIERVHSASSDSTSRVRFDATLLYGPDAPER